MVDSAVERTTGDDKLGRDNGPNRLSQLTSGHGGVAITGFAHAVLAQASEVRDRAAGIGKSLGRYVRPRVIAENGLRALNRVRPLPSWQARGVILPH